ncbi:hypothetical protein HZS55_20315 [Halosimplex rubrum]|uniref:DUF8135 domain-containing protein n=1 Tax=Halosimplex rubrum TaxID=869889 RepID=A0A7D5TEK3_9EURY|nr:hypothetical protein [Halosimplex rubrum]QLH79496.1 hypothetical protein HZS55_20315 [Halosimplex rubrum]
MSDDPDTDGSDESAEDGRGDPFESFGEYRERDGDPFDSLGDGPDGPDGDDAGPAGGEDDIGTSAGERDPAGGTADAVDPDPFEYMGDRSGSERVDATDEAERVDERSEDPLADVTVSDEDPFESSASAFERSGVEGIDPDEVWERLTAEPGASDGDADGAPAEGEEDDVVTVSKHGYCEGCEHFSRPPDVTCGHEGTDILAFVDVDRVQVSNCPVVEERRDLEEDA